MSIETIKKRIDIISDLQNEVKKLKEQYEEMFGENQVVQQAQSLKAEYDEKMAEVTEKIKAIKDQGAIKNILDEMKEVKTQIKENKEILSQELVENYKETGSMEITDNEGNSYFVKFAAKLKSN